MREEEGYNNNGRPEWEELPAALWSCILMRLKPVQVMRWRSVSRSCRRVVDQLLLKDQFYLNEAIRASSPGMLVCTPFGDLTDKGVEISYMWADNHEARLRPMCTLRGLRSYLVGPSINGFICMVDEYNVILLCNPVTGESLTLPMCPDSIGSNCRYSIFGFGYSPSTDEYKLVHLGLHFNLSGFHLPVIVFECSVLTFRFRKQRTTHHMDSSSWRRIEHAFDDVSFNRMSSGSVCVDGVIYWSGHASYDEDEPMEFIIACFHVGEEKFTTIPPPPASPYEYCSCLMEWQGRLCVGTLSYHDYYELDVMMLMGPDIWVRHLRVDFSKEPGLYTHALDERNIDFSCLSRDKIIVISGDTETWYIYDIKSKSWVTRSVMSVSGDPLFNYGSPVSSPIKESLLSLRYAYAPTCVV